MTLNRYLTRLIVLCVLPLLLLAIFLAAHHVRGLRAQQHQHAADRARNVASTLDQNLGARIGALQVLADSPLVDNPPRLEELYREAQSYCRQFGGQVILADLSMQMLFNTRVPFGTPLPKLPTPKGRAAAPTALATGRPAVGDRFIGRVAKEPLVAVVVPVNRGGRTTALLLSVIETTLLEERLAKVALPAQWSLSLRDGTGEVLARLGPKAGVGAIASDSVRSFEAKLSASPWVVILDIPLAVDRAPLITAAAILAVAILIVSLASALGGRIAGRRLARAVASLIETAPAEGTFTSIVEVDTARTLLTEANVVRDKNEAKLRENEERFRANFEQAAVGIAHVSLDGRWLRVNQKLCEIVGYSREELLTRTFQDITHPADLEADLDYARQLLTGELQTYSMEKRYIRCDGSLLWVNLTVSLVRDESNQPKYFISVVEDISVRKRAEEEIDRLNAELEQRVRERTAQLEAVNRELETFSYSVSHDLKAPLRGIDGYSRLLEADYRDRLDEEGRRFIANIRQGAAQMNELIEDLLNYSRLERRPLQPVIIDLAEVVRVVTAEKTAEFDRLGAILQLAVPSVKVRADRDGLAVVLRNLLDNALKFSHDAHPPTIEIGARQEGDKALLWVCDNGIGFDMKFHDCIFAMFQRLQRSEDFPGTGIGLALVRKAMERMNGRVWAESSPGQGATFFLEIPL